MNFSFGEVWKIILLLLGGVLAYGANFISERLVEEEDEDKKVKVKIALKITGFILVAIAAVTVMFV